MIASKDKRDVHSVLISYIWLIESVSWSVLLFADPRPHMTMGVFMLYRSSLVVFTIYRLLHNCEMEKTLQRKVIHWLSWLTRSFLKPLFAFPHLSPQTHPHRRVPCLRFSHYNLSWTTRSLVSCRHESWPFVQEWVAAPIVPLHYHCWTVPPPEIVELSEDELITLGYLGDSELLPSSYTRPSLSLMIVHPPRRRSSRNQSYGRKSEGWPRTPWL